jgi:hypothetical protein
MGIRRAQKRQDVESKRRTDNPPAPSFAPPIAADGDGINSARKGLDEVNSAAADLPEELIAARAHEKWALRGCPMGQDSEQDWYAARAELEAERLGWAAPQASDETRSASK